MKKFFLLVMLASVSIFSFANGTENFGFYVSAMFNSLIPIMAVACTMALPVLIVLLCLNFKKSKLKYAVIEKAIESGKEIPDSVFETPKKQVNFLNQGLTFLAVGIGLAVILLALADIRYASIGLLFILIGIGRVIAWWITRKSNNEVIEEK